MKRGFTLVELAVVIIIIALLVAIALPQFMRMQEKAKLTEARLMLDSLKKAELSYYAKNDRFTRRWTDLNGWVDASAGGPIRSNRWWTITIPSASDTQAVLRAQRKSGVFSGRRVEFVVSNDGTVTEQGDFPGV